ncbi:hypothetical protein F896_01192 [Acinetobacter genomosp. 15BJ]|uniref:Uncharacterized protein n=1 Tax=Acinetobacter genomosp. 15BJ TaxID=106651 RepID=R9B8F0_9GAMM|nr:hypothetical protein [Acinetobacter genomosp. 15BJ]EOR08666.1 hypothetical protein F896_01192 [Acinetobacter genomosp. 15BJ]
MKKLLFIGFLILGLAGCSKHIEEKSADTNQVEASNDDLAKKGNNSDQKPLTSWRYEESKDEMRNISLKFAGLESNNTVEFEFPYNGGSKLTIALRKNSQTPNSDGVGFLIDKGQFFCASMDGCTGSIKFGNGSIEKINLKMSDDQNSKILYMSNEEQIKSFIQKLKKGENLIVELPFFQTGDRQFSFDSTGLDWD